MHKYGRSVAHFNDKSALNANQISNWHNLSRFCIRYGIIAENNTYMTERNYYKSQF